MMTLRSGHADHPTLRHEQSRAPRMVYSDGPTRSRLYAPQRHRLNAHRLAIARLGGEGTSKERREGGADEHVACTISDSESKKVCNVAMNYQRTGVRLHARQPTLGAALDGGGRRKLLPGATPGTTPGDERVFMTVSGGILPCHIAILFLILTGLLSCRPAGAFPLVKKTAVSSS